MIPCDYCRARFQGPLEDAYAQGWGYLRFQFNSNERSISYCPAHKHKAFAEMISVTDRTLIPRPTKGGPNG